MTANNGLLAEHSVIGGLLLANNYFNDVAEIVSEADFAEKQNRDIFTVITRLHDEGKPFDLATLYSYSVLFSIILNKAGR